MLELPVAEPEPFLLDLLKKLLYHKVRSYVKVLVPHGPDLLINIVDVICKVLIVVSEACELPELVLYGCLVLLHELLEFIDVTTEFNDFSRVYLELSLDGGKSIAYIVDVLPVYIATES